MKRVWLRNLRTGAYGYLVRQVTDDLVEVKVPTEVYGDQQRFWKCWTYANRRRAPRSDRGQPRLRLVADRRKSA